MSTLKKGCFKKCKKSSKKFVKFRKVVKRCSGKFWKKICGLQTVLLPKTRFSSILTPSVLPLKWKKVSDFAGRLAKHLRKRSHILKCLIQAVSELSEKSENRPLNFRPFKKASFLKNIHIEDSVIRASKFGNMEKSYKKSSSRPKKCLHWI